MVGYAETAEAELRELPPSTKLVLKVLQDADGPLTQSELIEETLLSPRTTRYALNRLSEEGIIDEEIALADARKQNYSLRPPYQTGE